MERPVSSSWIDALNLPGHLLDRILCRVPPSPSAVASASASALASPSPSPSPSLSAFGREKPNITTPDEDTTPRNDNDDNDDNDDGNNTPANKDKGKYKSFVLYLPTVLLRTKHNPAFALACRLANHHNVPLLVLVTILDDTHLTNSNTKTPPHSPTTMTARRLAFTLEALRDGSCCGEWESLGAAVGIRIHGPGCRTPHHLSLAHSALAVVGDEPFVDPYRTYVRRIARTCRSASVPFWTVDGSTSVPPKCRLVRRTNKDKNKHGPGIAPASSPSSSIIIEDDVWWSGAPSKAWRWEKQTASVRKQHVYGAFRENELDAPPLRCRLPPGCLLAAAPEQTETETPAGEEKEEEEDDDDETITTTGGIVRHLRSLLPSKWNDPGASSPGQRPWTVSELSAIPDCKAWASAWHGADASVPPCQQTHGSRTAARRRWKAFLSSGGGLKHYAKKRNSIATPHAVSRISCYLNLGILSIFEVLAEVWQQSQSPGFATGCAKFLDEVVKWREGSYVHAFANPNYHSVDVLPPWAIRHLESIRRDGDESSSRSRSSNGVPGYTYEQLESASTGDETWNAMQDYLIETGELHNNARMTWGKTVVHWQARTTTPDEILRQLCCLNDRFALDGLSPPSYGGILWCFGWQDKPAAGQRVREKWAHRYRTGPDGFVMARERLLLSNSNNNNGDADTSSNGSTTIWDHSPPVAASGKRSVRDFNSNSNSNSFVRNSSPDWSKKARKGNGNPAKNKNGESKSILSYFGPAATKPRRNIG